MNPPPNSSAIHVCIISNNLLPNLIPVLMDRPALVHLVVNDDMAGISKRYQRLLENSGISFREHTGAPSTGLPQIREYAENLACELDSQHPGQPITLNATGGTKLMALAFVETFRELFPTANVIYTDTDHGCLESLTDRQQPTRPMTGVLDIPVYLASYGLTLRGSASDNEGWRTRAQERKALTKWLARQAGEISDFLGAMNGLSNQALDDRSEILRTPKQRFNSSPWGRWREAMEKIACHKLVEWVGDAELTFCDADSARYLGGFWLEEYAWHVVQDERPDDVRVGVEVTWEGGGEASARNEFDLLAVHNNRMLVVECKTQRFGNDEQSDQDILNKLESLGRNAGGLFGITLLLSARELSDRARARAGSYGIQVIESGQLKDLRKFVQSWMKMS